MPSSRHIRHYRGVVKDRPSSIVAISFSDSEVMGVIANEEGNFNLGLDTKYGKHIFYNEKNLKQKMSFECGTHSHGMPDYSKSVLFEKSKTAFASGDLCVFLYLETEYDIYQVRGSVASVENFISSIFNQVATLYQNENIETRLSEIFIWNTPDPYIGNNYDDLLIEFQDYRTTFSGDLGQLLTFRVIGGGKAAGFNGLCNSSARESLSVLRIGESFQSIPVYSDTVSFMAHEFGHLFGSEHTHRCIWNGNNTAIDGCAGITVTGCPLPPIPSAGGTIMSYCHLQSVGINFTLGFGPQPGNVIRNSVANADCLCECFKGIISGPSTLCTSDVYIVTNLPAGATVTGWSVSPAGAVSFSGSGNSRTVTRSGSYSGSITLTVMVATNCGTETIHKSLYAGSVTGHFIDGPTHVNTGWPSTYFAENTFQPGIEVTSRNWFFAVPPPVYSLTPISAGIAAEVIIGTPGMYVLALSVTNPCGASEATTLPIEVGSGGGMGGLSTVLIDPDGESIAISMPEEITADAVPDKGGVKSFVALLYDDEDNQVRKEMGKDGAARFDIRRLAAGTYRVQIKQGERIESHEIEITR